MSPLVGHLFQKIKEKQNTMVSSLPMHSISLLLKICADWSTESLLYRELWPRRYLAHQKSSDNKWLQFWDLASITVILSWRTLNNPIYYTVNSKWLLLLPLFHKNQQSSMKVIRLTPPALMEQFYMRLNAVATHLNAISANMGMATIKGEKTNILQAQDL